MEITLAHQIWSLVGALLILAAYVGHQLKFHECSHACVQDFERRWVCGAGVCGGSTFSDRLRDIGSGVGAGEYLRAGVADGKDGINRNH